MKSYIAISKAFCFPCVVKRIMVDSSAINGNKHIFAFQSSYKAHVIPKPAFYSSTLVIIGTSTFGAIFITTLKAVNIKFSHICTNFFKVFDKLTV